MAGEENSFTFDEADFTDVVDASAYGPSTQALCNHLTSRVIGQERAHRRIARGFATYNAGLKGPTEPIGTFLFAGPTGWGKTYEAQEIARYLIADIPRAPMTLVQCGMYSESYRVSELIGSPPGYVGSDEPPKLAQHFIDKPDFIAKACELIDEMKESKEGLDPDEMQELYEMYAPYKSVICFDEVEKAHRHIWDALLHIVDDGELSFANDEKTSFRNSVIILTCNVGGREQQDLISGRNGKMGFGKSGRDIDHMSDDEAEAMDAQIYKQTVELIEKLFAPELVGRLRDDIIVFRTLTRAQQARVLGNMLAEVQVQVSGKTESAIPIVLHFSQPFKEFLLDNGINRRYGLRPLKRAVRKYVKLPLANGLESQALKAGDEVLFTIKDGRPVLHRRARAVSPGRIVLVG